MRQRLDLLRGGLSRRVLFRCELRRRRPGVQRRLHRPDAFERALRQLRERLRAGVGLRRRRLRDA
jgi:hypothetical protein